jgi:hypothetical protein
MNYKKILLIGKESFEKQSLLKYFIDTSSSFMEVSKSYELDIYEFIRGDTVFSIWNPNLFLDSYLVGTDSIILFLDLPIINIDKLLSICKTSISYNNIPLVIYTNPKITKRIKQVLTDKSNNTLNILINPSNPLVNV